MSPLKVNVEFVLANMTHPTTGLHQITSVKCRIEVLLEILFCLASASEGSCQLLVNCLSTAVSNLSDAVLLTCPRILH